MTNKMLFDGRGNLVAHVDNDTLYTPDGAPLGLHLPHFGIFVDFDGSYLGEVVQGNRLMRRRNSPHALSRFSARGAARLRRPIHGTARHCPLPATPLYEEVAADRLVPKGARIAA
ncbi:hypothetical protein [Wenxinia marina]|uniref:Uncharacterized protein n=1 Tax=Wenxinia marina DSM 24838 TaxID=1123501 RepID=A0A0D0P7E2_9RHOB|nr:hypothetical protein [Wenxinia marina]KIQ67506.1 hypothetical protein Wenmar_03931 [Wenxinia marina DSM 24838]GGL68962.1 hypothetical protein GCM10011392_24280 [Wenxinia marina]